MNEATKRPWKQTEDRKGNYYVTAEGIIDICKMEYPTPEMYHNARLIVKAVNCHDELVGALKKVIEVNNRNGILSFGVIEQCEESLKKAGEL